MAGGDRSKADPALVVALAAGLTHQQPARQAGISERTVRRRLADPAFKQRIAETRAATIEQATAQLAAARLQAVQKLVQLLGGESESTQFHAAKAILELGMKFHEVQQVEERLSVLERQAKKRKVG
jgi:hypothetical protein